MTFRLAAITDLHDSAAAKGWLERASKAYTMVAVCGDIGFDIIEDVVNAIKQHPNIFLTLGNHDMPLTHIYNCPRILHGTKAQFEGYTIGGLGGSLPTRGFPFELDDTEYLVITKNMELEPKVDILISHQPPYNTAVDLTWQKEHVGSAAIASYIEKTQMPLVLTGHIHEASGFDKIGKTVIGNAGAFCEGKYLEVDLDGKEVTRAKIFYDKALEWPSWSYLLAQSRQKWNNSDLEPSLSRSRKA